MAATGILDLAQMTTRTHLEIYPIHTQNSRHIPTPTAADSAFLTFHTLTDALRTS